MNTQLLKMINGIWIIRKRSCNNRKKMTKYILTPCEHCKKDIAIQKSKYEGHSEFTVICPYCDKDNIKTNSQ